MECLQEFEFDIVGSKTLGTVSNPENVIPSNMLNGATTYKASIDSALNNFSPKGDIIFYYGNGTQDENIIFENDYLLFEYGNTSRLYGSTNYGFLIRDKVNNTNLCVGGWGGSTGPFPFYIAIVLDNENERGYFFLNDYSPYSGNHFQVLGGKSQGIDIFFESFGTRIPTYTSNGGGATHIAKVTGQLKDLSSNLSDILMVSGGGGGGYLVGEDVYDGADAGGISGSGSNSGNQSTGYAFGQGESSTNKSGGGGGYYGGYKSTV